MYAGEKQYGFEEILPIYKAVSSESDTGTFADFMEAFKTYDREGQGFINAAELRHVLCSLGMTRPVVTHCTRSVVSLCLSVGSPTSWKRSHLRPRGTGLQRRRTRYHQITNVLMRPTVTQYTRSVVCVCFC